MQEESQLRYKNGTLLQSILLLLVLHGIKQKKSSIYKKTQCPLSLVNFFHWKQSKKHSF